MPSNDLNSRRGMLTLLTTAFALALGLTACGRRGPLEPPVDLSAAAPPATASPADPRLRPGATKRQVATTAPSTALTTRGADVVADSPDSPDSDEEDGEDVTQTVSPIPTPRKRVRTYSVPKEPFVLDPLL